MTVAGALAKIVENVCGAAVVIVLILALFTDVLDNFWDKRGRG